jgi:hypothetical protein
MKKFNFNIDDFDMDIFDLERSKSILIAFDSLFPTIALALKTESNYYNILYPYVFSFFTTKKEYIDLGDQPLIASSKSFQDVKSNMEEAYLNAENSLPETKNIDSNQIEGIDKINPPLSTFELNDKKNYLDSTDI